MLPRNESSLHIGTFTRGVVILAAVLCAGSAGAQDDPAAEMPADSGLVPPAAINIEGVPAVPRAIAERISQYQNVRGAAFADWAPSGDGMLISTRFGNSSQLHAVYSPGGRREQLTFFEEPAGGEFVPQSATDSLLVTMSTGGNEQNQIYYLDRDAATVTLLTDGTSRNLLGPVSEDGQRMLVHNNSRNGRDTDMYLASTREPNSAEQLLAADGQYWFSSDWSADGGKILMGRYVSINEVYPAVFDVATRQLTELPLPTDSPAAFGGARFTPDATGAYLSTDARGEFLELAMVDLATGEYTWLTGDIPWDIDGLDVHRPTGRVAFTTNENGVSGLYLLEDGQRRKLDLPLGIVSGLKFSPAGEQLGFTLARPDAPADAYSLSLQDGELTRWTYSEVGGLNPAKFIAPQLIEVTSFDDRPVPAYYFRPRTATAEQPAPVLINIHGGPESQYKPYFSGISQFYLNDLGIAIIAPNVRGSAGYGKTYLKLDNAELREDSVRDIGALLDWIDEQPELDGSRVAVAGGSYGGYMVLGSLAMFGDRIRAGIDRVGIANFITFLEMTSPYRQDLRRAEYGDERDPQMRAFFEQINPTSKADKIRSALLISHGVNDPRVPYFEAQQIAEKVRATGQPVWTVYAENEGHGFAKKDNRDYLTAVETMFLSNFLLDTPAAPEASAAPASSDTPVAD